MKEYPILEISETSIQFSIQNRFYEVSESRQTSFDEVLHVSKYKLVTDVGVLVAVVNCGATPPNFSLACKDKLVESEAITHTKQDEINEALVTLETRMQNKSCHPNPTALVGNSLTDKGDVVELVKVR